MEYYKSTILAKDYKIESKLLGNIFSKKTKITFYIPYYQRNFSWEKQQVIEFFGDVYDQMEDEGQHYFGMIITLKRPKNASIDRFELIDGQQRIITSIIFLVCIRDILHELKSNLVKKINSEIFNNIAQSNESHYKIIHDNWDESFFRQVMYSLPTINYEFFYNIREKIPTDIYKSLYNNGKRPKKRLSKFPSQRLENESDKLLMKTYMIIREKIAEEINNKLDDPKNINNLKTSKDYTNLIINFLCKLHDTLIKHSLVSQITVNDENMVYSIFNGINNRGLKLSMSDTVKNWILYRIHKEKSKKGAMTAIEAIQQWKNMEKHTTKSKLDNYIHHYLITYNSKKNNDTFRYVNKSNSFSIIKDILHENSKSSLNSKPKATKLLIKICTKFRDYNLLTNPNLLYNDLETSNTQSKINKAAAANIYWLHRLQSVIVYPILMAGLEKYSAKYFEKLSEMVLKWFFINRTINKREAPQLERILAKITHDIMNQNSKEPFTIENVREALSDTTDKIKFFNELRIVAPRTDAPSAYFLTVLEFKKAERKSDITLEHIMPKRGIKTKMPLPDGSKMTWLEYIQIVNDVNESEADKIHKEYRNRLGNLTLLDDKTNKFIGGQLFPIKCNGVNTNGDEQLDYNNSDIKITKKIYEESEGRWTKERIEARQIKLVKQAEELWEI